jgi:hypothetical protein
MPIMDAATIWSAAGALGAIAVAGAAVWAARQSQNAAVQPDAAVGSRAAIERERRHDELDPEFWVNFTEPTPTTRTCKRHSRVAPWNLSQGVR